MTRARRRETGTGGRRADEFTGIRWSPPERILAEPIEGLDPQMLRFTRKLLAALLG